jgi:uncharacterized protein
MNEEYEVKMSPLSKEHSVDGKTVKIDIYEDHKGGWILEVVDEYGNSTIWDDPFKSDEDAMNEVMKTIKEEGIDTLIGKKSYTESDVRILH